MRNSRGGGIGLKPVYAGPAVVNYDTITHQLKQGGDTLIDTLTIGGVTISGSGTTYGITIGDTSKHVMISDHDISATGSVSANIIASGINARMEGGKVVAQNGLYIGYDGTDITKATYENSKFAVKGDDGSFKAAGGKFTVDKYGNIKKASSITTYTNTLSTIGGVQFQSNNIDTSGAITAGSLTLGTDYDVKQNIEDAKAKINTVEGNLSTNQANLKALQGRVYGHDTDINALKTKTQDIKYENDGSTTVDGVNFNGGAVSGVTSINNTHVGGVTLSGGTIEAASGKFKVYDNGAIEAAGGVFKVGSSGTINALGIQTHSNGSIKLNDTLFLNAADASLQDMVAGKAVSVAEMANTRDNTKKISYNDTDGTKIDSDVIINKGEKNQVKITKEEGIVVGLNSTVVGSDGVYAGGHTEATAKAVLGADGSIKGAGDGAGNYKFKVTSDGDVFSSSVTANLGGFNHVQINNGLTVGDAGGTNVAIGGGGIIATNGIDTVNVGNGAIVATGDIQGKDITATGNLSVAGTSTFTGKTTFSGGIKTDTIEEVTADKGVTVDGVLLKDGGVNASAMSVTGATGSLNVKDIGGTSTMIYTKKADGTNTIWIDPATGNISTNGTLQVGGGVAGTKPSVTIDGATGSIKVGQNDTEKFAVDGTTGNVKTEGSLEVASNATVGGTLGVTGKTTLNDELQVDKTATFGTAVGSQTVIKGDQITTGRIETDATQASKIGGVTLQNGKVTATDMTVTGTIDFNNLKVKDTLTVGTNTKITEGTLQLGTVEDNKLTADKLANINQTIKSGRVIDATSATIGDVEIKGGNVTTTTGTITGKTISDGAGATLTGGKITAKEGKIGNVEISAAGAVTGVKSIEANTFKVDEENYLNGNGITAKGGHIGGAVIDATTLNIGNTTLDKANGISTNKLTIDGMTLTDKSLDTGTATFEVNGVEFKQGQVTAMADKGFVAGTSSFKQDSLIVDANNKLEATNGLTTEKATVNGTLDVTGKATFGAAGQQTTIEGDAVTTDTLKANKLILGASGDTTVEVDKDGSLIAAKGKFEVNKDGALKAANGAFNVDKDGKTTFTKDAANLSSINGGNIWAKATDIADNTSSELTHDYKGLHIKGNKSGQKSAFDFDTASGIGTFTGQDKTTTTINGSAITSTKATDDTGVLDGSNLTLTNGTNSTALTAGGATFTKDGKTTTISGDTITTGTLNVTDIVLGGTMYDTAGHPLNSKLSIGNDGHLRAANGNFDVKKDGTFTNTVGNTTLKTDTTSASMKVNNTAAEGGVTSEVTVEANKATVAAGDKASFVATTDNGGTATITGGTQTVTTTDKGTVFENSAHKTAFVTDGATNTIINGNEITTGKITTDQLVITGQGNANGKGSIAFGGNGTIKSDINDGNYDADGKPNGQNTSFETKLEGVNTKVTNGTITTENQVTAAGNSNTVKQDDEHKSEFNQGLTSIGGVVTNGEIKVAQKLDGATGLLTNEVTNDEGKWSKLEQSGTGLTYTDSAKPDNATRIDSSDVSIGSATNDKDRINLSDLGQIDDLDQEIRDNEVYKNNETAVGGINAEAAIRRGEVERLDNRISEEVTRLDGRINDVNDRVNKVGAMAAAIASLKSIGYDPQAPSEFSIGLGQYKGETGVAMGFFHYPNKNFMINVSLSTAGGETMGGIGATWRFGHKSPQKLLEEQREAQAKKELAAAEKYQAAAKLAKEAQERAEYAAKLARQAQVSADNAKAAADATQAKHFG